MEVRLEFETVAQCHPEDVWQIFRNVEDWHKWCSSFGHAGWVHGQPWKEGSRFFVELLAPFRADLEVLVLKAREPQDFVLLSHGAGMAVQQWVQFRGMGDDTTVIHSEEALVGSEGLRNAGFREAFRGLFEQWLDLLRGEAEKHCSLIAL